MAELAINMPGLWASAAANKPAGHAGASIIHAPTDKQNCSMLYIHVTLFIVQKGTRTCIW